ncbi:uncharacterized protein LOC119114796 [Pollicipes pollicipes]|uniref:uncharacterized protein LOC119114796 n=1 Tax=Pollicipes pollicipes TaxID=41117 RepID=UPI001884B1CB|nr:uncharacterized protein LOC119114796 [Pollicipes pollicipes]
MASGGGRQLKADVFCALAVSEDGAGGVYLDREQHRCQYYRRPLPRLTDDYDEDEAAVANLVAGVRHWEDDWRDEHLDAVVFSDCGLVEPLSPYRLANLFGPRDLPEQFAQLAVGGAGDPLRKELRELQRDHDIVLQYAVADAASMHYHHVPEKDCRALDTGSALLDVAGFLARHVYADVDEIDDRLQAAVGDGRELEVETNRGTNVPENCLFER